MAPRQTLIVHSRGGYGVEAGELWPGQPDEADEKSSH